MSVLQRLSKLRSSRFQGGPPAPDQAFYAIGDVHGRDDLLEPLLTRLLDQAEPIVLVGDYVDRGENSADVLDRLHALRANPQVICLRGNHEEMMLKFLEKPKKHGRIWLRYGGLQTLGSYGIGGITADAGPDDLMQARDALAVALGDQHAWLLRLPYVWQSGNMAVVHAGADPARAIDDQPTRAFAWGHQDFATKCRTDGTWVIYGHVIVPQVNISDGKVAIDTGAYASNRLTAVHVTTGTISVVTQ